MGALVPSQGGYDSRHFDKIAHIENRHFWFTSRNQIIATVVSKLVERLPPGFTVIEFGCGTGNVLQTLSKVCARGRLIGMDLFGEGLTYARRRTCCWLVQADISRSPLKIPADVIGLFDVLEHLRDDRMVLADLYLLLKPGGALVLTVPACTALWSYFDEASHHFRRYEVKELQEKLAEAGFEVEYLTYYMMGIYPLVWALRRLTCRKPRTAQGAHEMSLDELKVVPGLNGILRFLLSWEAPLLAARLRLPLGTSLLAVARKPSE